VAALPVGTQHDNLRDVKGGKMHEAPVYVSYSQITSWMKCGEAYRLEKVVRVPSKPAWYFAGGSAVHTATEWFDTMTAREQAVADGAELFREAFQQEIEKIRAQYPDIPMLEWRASGRATKEYPGKQDGNWWDNNGPAMVQGWIDFRRSTAWQLLEVEVEVDGQLGGVPVKAYIDRVFATPEGELAVVDLKTGAREPESSYQLGWYADQYEQIFGQRPSIGAYWMARKNQMTEPESLHLWTRPRLDYWVNKFDIARKNNIYLPNVGSHCRSCGVADYCPATGGKFAAETEDLNA